jgi:hypothetical protein
MTIYIIELLLAPLHNTSKSWNLTMDYHKIKVGLEVKIGPILEELKIESLELWKIRLTFIKLKKLACIKTKVFFQNVKKPRKKD